jgi:tetratricopeptide (TPR) repeat protein
LADACAVALVYRLFAGELRKPGVRAGLIVLAGSPALVLVSGFHGNTDSIIMCLLLLSVCWTERAGRDVLSGAALGLALCIKIVPLVVVPALLLYRVEWGRRLRFVLGAAGVVGVAWVPWMLPDASRALAQVFGYRGQYGHWGVSWLAAHLLPGAAGLNAVLRSAGFPLLAAGVLALSVRMNRRSERPAAYAQLGVVFAALLAFGSAFGVQYLAWLSPWLVGLPVAAVLLHALAAGAFLLVVYNYWSGALPWFLADSNQVGDYAGHADYQQVLCWVSVVIVFGAALMQVEARSLRWPSVRLAPAKWWQFGALAAAVALAWPSVVLFRRDATRGPKVSEQALVPILAQQDVKLSSVLMRTGRNQEGVEVARRATETDPGQALAWNNLAAGYAGLALWDEAIVAAERAVRLSPRFQLAHTNLAWARQQKAQEQARAAHR